ncbi:hypothetical protein I5907_13130 [Panacibacter sp. DH6]|uniref:Uncharacterized protein n=1 Tax=Panacibacter microcysteis TaxID=2793269 RepID=A0A931E8E6_9BACT|nr:hypothetical protein [Panacibacter microcysteis]MBG9377180.1 hypothetical protein [Panacibacter microcysteis]
MSTNKVFILIGLCTAITHSVFSQGLWAHIDDWKAQTRVAIFRDIKSRYLTSANVDHYESIKLKSSDILPVLDTFAKIPDADGLRIYFLFTDESHNLQVDYRNKLTLLLIPTKLIENKSIDINDKAFVWYNGKFNSVNKQINTDIRSWLNRYKLVMLGFEKGLKSDFPIHSDYREDSCLWYSQYAFFRKFSNSKKDLATYLQESEKEFEINFAAWSLELGEKKYAFKTDLIFKIDNGYSYTFAYNEVLEDSLNISDSEKEKLLAAFANTGSPCPPDKCP